MRLCRRKSADISGTISIFRIDGWVDGRTDGRTDGRMDGWMDEWIDGLAGKWELAVRF